MWTWRAVGLGLAVVVAATTGARAADERATPVAVVETLHVALLGLLKDAERLGYAGRFERIAPVVGRTFDGAFMAEKAVGRHWKTFTDEQRTRWTALFAEFTAANYAGNFDRFSGQRFETLGEEPGANDTRLVRTMLRNPSGEDVELTYRLQHAADGWRIVDIQLKGTVSELALRRSDYTSVLDRDEFDGLATMLRSKIDDLAAGRGKRTGP